MELTQKTKAPKRIAKCKHGWMSYLFGIESAALLACDARWNGSDWERKEPFRFLYASRLGVFFLLSGLRNWTVLTKDQAVELFRDLPVRCVSEERAFAPGQVEPVAETSDVVDGDYYVVRNSKGEFSIRLACRDPLDGWERVAVFGTKAECLEYVNQHCVFGAFNAHCVREQRKTPTGRYETRDKPAND